MKSRRGQSRQYWAVELRFYMLTRLLSERCTLEFSRDVEAKDARDSGAFNLGAEGVLGAGPVWHCHEEIMARRRGACTSIPPCDSCILLA